jgi:hypothetical protein
MTPAQTALYFREWQRVRDVRKSAGLTCGDVERHALHKKALGASKSSKDFTNADLDKVLATFRAITEPGNLAAQLRAQEQPEARRSALMARARDLAARCVDRPGREGVYLDGMASRLFQVDQYHLLNEHKLAQLCGILERRISQLDRATAENQPPGELGHNCPW